MGEIWQPLVRAVALDEDIEAVRSAWESVHARSAPPPETDVRAVTAGGVPALAVGETQHRPRRPFSTCTAGDICSAPRSATARTPARWPRQRHHRAGPGLPAGARTSLSRGHRRRRRRLPVDSRSGNTGQAVTVTGDSSGGGLVLSLLLTLRARGLPLPGAAILLCPWLDFGLDDDGEDDHGLVSLHEARRFANAYLAGHPADDPVINPLRADLSGLPPLLVQAAAGDERLIDAQTLTERAAQHGVDARLEIYPVDAHVFHIFWSFLPLAHDALRGRGRIRPQAPRRRWRRARHLSRRRQHTRYATISRDQHRFTNVVR